MRKTGEQIVKDIQHATRKHYSSKEKIRIVLDDLRGEDNENLSGHWSADNDRMPSCVIARGIIRRQGLWKTSTGSMILQGHCQFGARKMYGSRHWRRNGNVRGGTS
ncbi:MAG: hypothetical protein ABJV60_10725 [Lentilitoribacter sp.]